METKVRWAIGQQELLAIIESLEYWRHYLEAQEFTVLTDHEALKGVLKSPAKDLRGRLARWVMRLAAFDFHLLHQPGKSNHVDGLSWRSDYMEGKLSKLMMLDELSRKLNLDGDIHPCHISEVQYINLVSTMDKKEAIIDSLLQGIQRTHANIIWR
jgi:reverse transcriptase-like protein